MSDELAEARASYRLANSRIIELLDVKLGTVAEQCIQTYYAVLSDFAHKGEPFTAKQILDEATAHVRKAVAAAVKPFENSKRSTS